MWQKGHVKDFMVYFKPQHKQQCTQEQETEIRFAAVYTPSRYIKDIDLLRGMLN